MKNSKRKILIASFFAVLMLMVPLASAVTETKTVQNLQVKQSEQELILQAQDSRSGLLKVIYMIAEEMVQELLDAGLNVNENTELLQAQMQQILASEEYDLTTILNQELLISGESRMEQGVQDMGVGSNPGKVSGSSVVGNTEIGMELQGTSIEVGFESYQNIYTYLAGDLYTGFTPGQIQERLGWINGMINLIEKVNKAKEEWQDTFIPNITWVNIIEDWGSWIGINIDVEQLFTDLEAYLLVKFAGYPLIGEIIPAVLQALYERLNKKVGDNLKSFLNKVKSSIRTFIRVWRGKITDVSPRKALRKILFWTMVLSLDAWLVLFHCNPLMYPERWNRWEIERFNAKQNFSDNLTKFYNWLGSEPWLESVHINGTIAGLTEAQLLGIETLVYCEKDPTTRVTVDENGYFEGLDFVTENENPNWGLHKCVTTTSNSIGTITLGNHIGSGSLAQNILEVGAFSGGNLTLNFDFSGQGNSYPGGYVVQTQPAQQTKTQTTTQSK
jgi:hypothetical protein